MSRFALISLAAGAAITLAACGDAQPNTDSVQAMESSTFADDKNRTVTFMFMFSAHKTLFSTSHDVETGQGMTLDQCREYGQYASVADFAISMCDVESNGEERRYEFHYEDQALQNFIVAPRP